MAEAAVSFLLENLTQLFKSYVDLISGAENELNQLKKELGLLRAFLVEAGNKQKEEGPYRELERQIRDVVYDAEDTIDECLTQAAAAATASKTKRFLGRTGLGKKKFNLAKKVKTLREEKVTPMFSQAKLDFAKMEIRDGSAPDVDTTWRKPGKIQLIREDNVVGFEDEQETITGYLKEQTGELDVISIIGMPGLGKTTLAWKIFQDKDLQYLFSKRIWVYVSQDFNPKEVLLKILKEFTNVDMSRNTEQDLANTVRNYLEQGPFFLVMDDVWTVQAWNEIKKVLPIKKSPTSKVLITSRSKEVGDHASLIRPRHDLRFLTKDESWDLLQYEVFGKIGACPTNLEGIGKLIAKHCDGLPLAIVVIGGVLVDYNSTTNNLSTIKNAWEKVSENVSIHVKDYDKDRRVLDMVSLSYKNLPDEQRNCFIYMGVFPEDHEIPAWTLTRLWIAEGFIQKKDNESLEETAESNLNELINRNLVMLEKTNPEGSVKTCRVHDVIREFCKDKAGTKWQNLFKDVMLKDGVFDPSVSDLGLYRRLSVHSHIPAFLSQKNLLGPKVRSLLCCNKGDFTLDANLISKIPEAFTLLRVLETKSFKFSHFPPRVPKLLHLRYVTLSFEKIDALPESISELLNLQTLLIDTTSRTLEIQGNIWKLIQLRHLKTKAAILLKVLGEPDQVCENLQTLTRVDPEYCTREVLKRACNIKRLGIRGKLSMLFEKKISLEILGRLENLKMVNDVPNVVASENPLSSLPQSNFFPSKVKRLTLSATYLEWSHMKVLGSMACLQVLKLKEKAFKGHTWNADGNKFPALQFLLISNSQLVYWTASNKDFPSLQCLELKNCEDLDEIPEGMVRGLQKLSIECVGKSAVDIAKRIKNEKESLHGHGRSRWSSFELKLDPRSK